MWGQASSVAMTFRCGRRASLGQPRTTDARTRRPEGDGDFFSAGRISFRNTSGLTNTPTSSADRVHCARRDAGRLPPGLPRLPPGLAQTAGGLCPACVPQEVPTAHGASCPWAAASDPNLLQTATRWHRHIHWAVRTAGPRASGGVEKPISKGHIARSHLYNIPKWHNMGLMARVPSHCRRPMRVHMDCCLAMWGSRDKGSTPH